MNRSLTPLSLALAMALSVALPGAASAAPSLAGHWTGVMIEQGQSLPVSFDFDADQAHGRFTSPTQRAMDFPLDGVTRHGDQVAFSIGGGIKVEAALSGGATDSGAMAGTFKMG